MAVTTVRVCDSERTVFGFILNKAIDLHAKPGVSRGALAGCGTSMDSADSDTSVPSCWFSVCLAEDRSSADRAVITVTVRTAGPSSLMLLSHPGQGTFCGSLEGPLPHRLWSLRVWLGPTEHFVSGV